MKSENFQAFKTFQIYQKVDNITWQWSNRSFELFLPILIIFFAFEIFIYILVSIYFVKYLFFINYMTHFDKIATGCNSGLQICFNQCLYFSGFWVHEFSCEIVQMRPGFIKNITVTVMTMNLDSEILVGSCFWHF